MPRRYIRHQEKNDTLARERVCAELGCVVVGTVSGLCKKHYNHWHQVNVRVPLPRRYCRCGAEILNRAGTPATCGKKECRLARRRERYRKNPGPVLAAIRRWNGRNKEWWQAYHSRSRDFHGAIVSEVVFERDGWRCQLCGRKVKPDKASPHPMAPVVDHILPLSKGGTHEYRNVQTAHHLCNNRKGNRVLGLGEQLRLIG